MITLGVLKTIIKTVYTDIFILRSVINMYISNYVHIKCIWNNLHQVHFKSNGAQVAQLVR